MKPKLLAAFAWALLGLLVFTGGKGQLGRNITLAQPSQPRVSIPHRITMPDSPTQQPSDDPGLKSDSCDGRKASIGVLHGWFRRNSGNRADNEVHYAFELDIEDTLRRGIKLSSVLHAGQLFQYCENQDQAHSFAADRCRSNGTWYALAAPPIIHVELGGWNVNTKSAHMPSCTGETPPHNWFDYHRTNLGANDGDQVIFPYDPMLWSEDVWQYSEVEGSILADYNHCVGDPVSLQHAKGLWARSGMCANQVSYGYHTGFGDQSRWIEIHPPDRIAPLPEPSTSYSQTLVAVGSPYSDQDFSFDLAPRIARPSRHIIDLQEDIIIRDSPDKISATFTKTDAGVHVHIFGRKAGTLGSEWSDGPRYLAVLRVGWNNALRIVFPALVAQMVVMAVAHALPKPLRVRMPTAVEEGWCGTAVTV